MKRDYLWLIAVWLLIGLAITILAIRHLTQATSPDSTYYLRMAADWHTYDGTFPPGYSILIGFVSFITMLPGLWASKLVNWLALGYLGWAWAGRIGPQRSAVLLAIWLLPGNLRIATYTWSETIFVVLLLEAVWFRYLIAIGDNPNHRIRLAGMLIVLAWVRYVGLFLLMLPRTNWIIRIGAVTGITLLLLGNIVLTGYPFGGPRFLPTEPWPKLMQMFAIAVLNELLLYNLQPDSDLVQLTLATIGQVVMLASIGWWLYSKSHWQPIASLQNPLVRELFVVGSLYFLTLFVLRTVSPFDPLNERLMVPGSICWLTALVLSVQSQHSIMSKSPTRAEMRTNPS